MSLTKIGSDKNCHRESDVENFVDNFISVYAAVVYL